MKNGKSKLFLGLILLFLAVAFTISVWFRAERHFSVIFLSGIALVLLYVLKGKVWALLLGMAVILAHISCLFFQTPSVRYSVFYGVLGIGAGLSFLYEYYKKKNEAAIVPGCFLAWAGAFCFFLPLDFVRRNAACFFVFCLGMVHVSAFLIRRRGAFRYLAPIGIGLLLLALFLLEGFPV